MRFLRLDLTGFGRFGGLGLELGPGLNVVVGPNEAGKTTLVNAVLGVLYGLRGRSAHLRELRERYRPWSGGPYQAALTLEDSQGRVFKIERDFEAGEAEVWRPGPGGAWSRAGAGALKRLLEEDLGLPTPHLFLGTLLVRQQEVATLTQDVGEALVAQITQGEDDIPARKALEALERRLKEVTCPGATKNPGALEVLAAEIAGLEEELATTEGRLGEYQERLEAGGRLEAELSRATARRDLLRPTVSGLERLQGLEASLGELRGRQKDLERRRRRIAEARERLAACERALEGAAALGRYLAEVDAGRAPDVEALAAQRRAGAGEAARQEAALERARADLRELEARRDEVDREAARLEPELGADANSRARVRYLARALREAGARLAGPATEAPLEPGLARRATRAGALAAGAVCGAALGGVAAWLVSPALLPRAAGALTAVLAGILAGALLGLFLAWAVARALGACGPGAGAERRRLEALLRAQCPLPVPEVLELEGRLEALESERDRVAAALEARRRLLSQQEEQASQAGERLAGAQAALAAALQRAGQPGPEGYAAAVREYRALAADRDGAAEALKALLSQGSEADLEDTLDALAAQVRTQEREAGELKRSLPPLAPDAVVELKGEYDQLEAAVPDLGRRLAVAAAQTGSYERLALGRDPWEVRARLACAREEREESRREAGSLRWALTLLEEAARQARGRAASGLGERVGEALGYITGGRYREARVRDTKEAVEVLVKAPETGAWVEPTSLSTGAADQVFFALRLALAEYLTGGRAFPLILDDPFVNFDAARLGRTLEFLDLVARTHQVLWLTKDEPLARARAVATARLHLLPGAPPGAG